MATHSITAKKRLILGRKVKKLRKEGKLPANIYGKKTTSLSIEVDGKEFNQVFDKAGETGIVEVLVDGKKYPSLIQNVQRDPITSGPLHVDFHTVDLKEKIIANVPLSILSEAAPAVKDKKGSILALLSEVEVEALPTDLPEKIEVATDALAQEGDAIKVSALSVPHGVRIVTDGNIDVAKVVALVSKEAEQMAKEQEAAATAAATAEEATQTETEEKKESTPTAGSPAENPDTKKSA